MQVGFRLWFWSKKKSEELILSNHHGKEHDGWILFGNVLSYRPEEVTNDRRDVKTGFYPGTLKVDLKKSSLIYRGPQESFNASRAFWVMYSILGPNYRRKKPFFYTPDIPELKWWESYSEFIINRCEDPDMVRKWLEGNTVSKRALTRIQNRIPRIFIHDG